MLCFPPSIPATLPGGCGTVRHPTRRGSLSPRVRTLLGVLAHSDATTAKFPHLIGGRGGPLPPINPPETRFLPPDVRQLVVAMGEKLCSRPGFMHEAFRKLDANGDGSAGGPGDPRDPHAPLPRVYRSPIPLVGRPPIRHLLCSRPQPRRLFYCSFSSVKYCCCCYARNPRR